MAATDPRDLERARLSRELHDDIAQRIALLATELAILRRRLAGAPADVQEHIARMASETATLGDDVHRMARGLHPATLEQLGLEASIRNLCSQLASAHRITIGLHVCHVPSALDRDAALCLYRIVQEALQNVVKHSGARHATLSLTTGGNDVVLRVMDRGVGFDEAMPSKGTLGLTGMRERARLVNARLLVSSKPGGGTLVEARVPLGRSFRRVSA